jgi:hypothetical protein
MASLEHPFRRCHGPRDAKAGDRGSLGAGWATGRVRSAPEDLRDETPPSPSRETRERFEHRSPRLVGPCVHQNLVFIDFGQGGCEHHFGIMTRKAALAFSVCLARSGEWELSPAERVSGHGDAAPEMRLWWGDLLEQPKVRLGCPRRSDCDPPQESRPEPAASARTHFGMRRFTGDRFGHSIGQGRNEASRILGGHPKSPRAGVALPQRNYDGGICRVGRDPHAANVTPGVVEPDSFAIKVALHRHRSIITSATLFGYWGSGKAPRLLAQRDCPRPRRSPFRADSRRATAAAPTCSHPDRRNTSTGRHPCPRRR